MNEFYLLKEAEVITFVLEWQHHKQKYGKFHYLSHLQKVYETATLAGCNDSDILLACWLHDTLEDTPLSYNDIRKLTCKTVADIVAAVTGDSSGKNRAERAEPTYPKMRANPKALAVKLCDRISNVNFSLAEFLNDSSGTMIHKYIEEQEKFENELLRANNLYTEDEILNDCILHLWGCLKRAIIFAQASIETKREQENARTKREES